MRVAIIGNNDGPDRLAASLAGSSHKVVCIGRQKIDVPDEAAAERLLADVSFDLLVNCFANFRYRRLHLRYPAVNVHLAPLPAYRGRHPLQWALINGETEFGATIHDITDAYDAGTIRWQDHIAVEDGWSAAELREALLRRVELAFPSFLDTYDPGNPGLANDPAAATYVTRRFPEDGRITDWSDRDRVFRTVRALRHDDHPAYVVHAGNQHVLSDARRDPRRFVGAIPGTLAGRRGEAVLVACGYGGSILLSGSTLHALPVNAKL
ncbi:formyltransferase family protein [Lewinella sp. IMCC34183]|uniref:formyltransferase family protein n=1 Tax=Lewinella sp. IMCC34183 TaxID=2248762 RepID=UPI000E249508|nr:formyltransferase family protein [Lewinella sp. IMCC34183]